MMNGFMLFFCLFLHIGVFSFKKYGHDVTIGHAASLDNTYFGGIPRYVDPLYGNNLANFGNFTHPFKDLQFAVNNCNPLDTIYLRDSAPHNYRVQIRENHPHPLEVRSFPGEWAVFDGSGLNVSVFYVFDISFIVIRNLEIRNVNMGFYLCGISVSKSANITIENVYIHHSWGSGLSISGSHNVYVGQSTFAHNWDPEGGGENADGVHLADSLDGTECYNNTFYRVLVYNNSDDGFDTWTSKNNTFIECISYLNGYDVNGNGNGFKLGGNTDTDGGMTLIRCIAVNNKVKGFDENTGLMNSYFYNCLAFNNTQRNYHFTESKESRFVNCISMNSSCWFPSTAILETSLGCMFGWENNVSIHDFESYSIDDINSEEVGSRFFFPKSSAKYLIDKGTIVPGLSYLGSKPDISPNEYYPPTHIDYTLAIVLGIIFSLCFILLIISIVVSIVILAIIPFGKKLVKERKVDETIQTNENIEEEEVKNDSELLTT